MNGLKTTMLLAALTALFMGLGYMLGGSGGAIIALLVAAGCPRACAIRIRTGWCATWRSGPDCRCRASI